MSCIGGSGMRPGRDDGGDEKSGYLGEWWVRATKWRRCGAVEWRNGRREAAGKRQVINRSERLSTHKGDLSTESEKTCCVEERPGKIGRGVKANPEMPSAGRLAENRGTVNLHHRSTVFGR